LHKLLAKERTRVAALRGIRLHHMAKLSGLLMCRQYSCVLLGLCSFNRKHFSCYILCSVVVRNTGRLLFCFYFLCFKRAIRVLS